MKRCLRCDRGFQSIDWICPSCGFAPAISEGFLNFAPELAATEIGYDAQRFEVLAGLERDHFWFRSRTELVNWALHKHFSKARSLLEIGCGTGNVAAKIAADNPHLHVVGSEVHVAGLAFAARRTSGVELIQMDARRLPYREEFDVVGAFDVIEHISDDAQVLREMYAACRPGGGIIVTVPQHKWLWSYRDEYAGHRRRYVRNELLAALAAAGFTRPWCTSFVMLLLPLMAASRMSQRTPRSFDPSSELKVGRFTNRILSAVMALECGLIRAGVSLPAGGSLLAIAHKTEN
jgi:ubiquinone/menaquinone biosynthesis C-methylase UbiE